ncbi:hypothetical protein WJX72_001199 [[Myrmecia] bisecta]|uniref:Uncharacterized protein n=1 Tax=[Myrmecia] bisecta TaxID=41462 RepID=A0AAW1P2I8_9CHLO
MVADLLIDDTAFKEFSKNLFANLERVAEDAGKDMDKAVQAARAVWTDLQRSTVWTLTQAEHDKLLAVNFLLEHQIKNLFRKQHAQQALLDLYGGFLDYIKNRVSGDLERLTELLHEDMFVPLVVAQAGGGLCKEIQHVVRPELTLKAATSPTGGKDVLHITNREIPGGTEVSFVNKGRDQVLQ